MPRSPLILSLLALATAGCGASSRIEGRYTCTNSDSLAFSPDGIVTYQGRFGPGREYPYVIDGDAVRILRREDRDPVGDNVYLEYAKDGDRLVRVRKGERDEQFFCQQGNAQPQAVAPSPEPTEAFVPRERPGTQVAEVLGLRLGDPLEDVRRKLETNANPFREVSQTTVSENPDVVEQISFMRTPQPGARDRDDVVVYFSPPPQRLLGLERRWLNLGNQILWSKVMAPAIERYGQPVDYNHLTDSWYLNEHGRPIEPPTYAKKCGNWSGIDSSVTQNLPPEMQPRCGRVLEYTARGIKNNPVDGFAIKLYDPDAINSARKGWAEAARQASERQAQANLDAAKVPDQ